MPRRQTIMKRTLAIKLLILLLLTPLVSLAQEPSKPGPTQTPEVSLPPADALILIDFKRVMNEVFPRLVADEPALQSLVLSEFYLEQMAVELRDLFRFNPLTVEHVAIGLRYANLPDKTSNSDFMIVAIAKTNDAARLPALLRQPDSTKLMEEQYKGKTLFLEKAPEPKPEAGPNDKQSGGRSVFAITALNETTVVFGDLEEVRASIDVNAGKSNETNREQFAALKRSPDALLSTAIVLPPSLTEFVKKFGNPQLTEALSSLKWVYASVELSSGGFNVAATIPTASPEQASNLAEVLGAWRTLANSFSGVKTKDKTINELMRRLVISTDRNELQLRAVVTQETANTLAKSIASDNYVSRGVAQMEDGDPEGAITQFDKAIMLAPDKANALLKRGTAHSQKGTLDAALADLDKAIALEESALAYNNRGSARIKKEEFDAAIRDLDKSIQLDPTFGAAYYNRGYSFAQKGDMEKAIADFDKSIAHDQSNPFAFANRGFARTGKGELDGALADFDRAIAINPKMAEAYNGRGEVRYERYSNSGLDRELNQAIDDYSKGISLDTNNPEGYSDRGYALIDKEEYDRAIADFDKSIALNPTFTDAYIGRGIARYSKEEFNRALADLDKAIALAPEVAVIYCQRALPQLALRLDAQAAQDLKKCYELDQSLRETYEPLIKDIKNSRRAKPRRRR